MRHNAMKQSVKRVITLYLPLLIIVFFAVGPYIWTFISSITPENDLYLDEFRFFPELPTGENYLRLFTKLNFGANILDSTLIALATSLIGLMITVPASYSFSRFRFQGSKLLLMQFLIINMFPIMLLILPLFIIIKITGLMDTHFALIIAYSTFTIPFSVWMLTSYFNAIPYALDQAAQVDGCTQMGALVRIVLPVAMPGVFSTGILCLYYSLERVPVCGHSDQLKGPFYSGGPAEYDRGVSDRVGSINGRGSSQLHTRYCPVLLYTEAAYIRNDCRSSESLRDKYQKKEEFSMEIQEKTFEGEGMHLVFDNGDW